MSNVALDNEYQQFLIAAKQQYKSAQLKAAYAVNAEMIQFYWQLGKQLMESQMTSKWGSKLLPQFSKDMQAAFPGTKGFSVSNLERMRKFAILYPDLIAAQPARQLPWWHIVILIERVKDPEARDWYAQYALENGISRNVLMMQIKQGC